MSTASTRLTVIVPCYRAEASLARCLTSVLASARSDLHVVVVDDASPEPVATIGTDPTAAGLTVVRRPVNSGPGAARNTGLEHARGEYVWFVDADDELTPGAIDAVLASLAATRADVLLVDHAEVWCDRVVHRRCRERLGPVDAPFRLAEHPRALRLEPSACTKIVRRALLDEHGLRFPPGRYEDVFFSRAVLAVAERIDILDRTCYLYRQGTPGSTTSSTADWHFDIFDQYARLFAYVDRHDHGTDLRPELFRVMVDHYLVVLGHPTRVPRQRRREFFARVAADVDRFRPPRGYDRPGGVTGLKHRLAALGRYRPYAVLRWAYRLRPGRGR